MNYLFSNLFDLRFSDFFKIIKEIKKNPEEDVAIVLFENIEKFPNNLYFIIQKVDLPPSVSNKKYLIRVYKGKYNYF